MAGPGRPGNAGRKLRSCGAPSASWFPPASLSACGLNFFSQGERKIKNTPLPVAQRRRRPCAARRWAPPVSRHWYIRTLLSSSFPLRLFLFCLSYKSSRSIFLLVFFSPFFEIRMRVFFSCNGEAPVFILILIRCRKDYIVYKLRNELSLSQAFRSRNFRTLLMR